MQESENTNASRYDAMLRFLEETLQLKTEMLGPVHPDVLVIMHNLASFYFLVDQLDKALPLFEETLTLMKAELGINHPDTLISMNNLALAYRATGQFSKAASVFEELATCLHVCGLGHPTVEWALRQRDECLKCAS